ncbi:flagellar hook protein FlgE [Bradyrhizobium sp. AZCC 1610]|jgi:hypothetical protein|uniref:hypothetical protein n=1 Tax=Bradyrhizobium sp. AZCC 1610 TaxID=3117020 RepID=UPI002FEE7395
MEIRIGWNDVGDPTRAGDYKFRDGTVTLTDEQIDLWIAAPAGYFVATQSSDSKPDHVRYLVGEFYAPTA